MPNAGAPPIGVETERTKRPAGVRLECSAMNSRGRNPVAQSLALAVLGVALLGALILGAAVLAVLFVVFVAGYVITFAHAYARLLRLRNRAAYVDRLPRSGYIDAEFAVAEAVGDAGRPGSGGAA